MCSFDACAGISYPSVAWLPPLLTDVAIVVNVGVLECSSPTTGIPTCLYLYIRYPTDVCLCEDIGRRRYTRKHPFEQSSLYAFWTSSACASTAYTIWRVSARVREINYF